MAYSFSFVKDEQACSAIGFTLSLRGGIEAHPVNNIAKANVVYFTLNLLMVSNDAAGRGPA